MKEVKIFTATSIKGLRATSGAFGYVLETQGKRSLVTREGFGTLDAVTKNQAELRVITEALSRMLEPCFITIYTESAYVAAGMEQVDTWRNNGWMTSRNTPVANKEEWMQMLEKMKEHAVRVECKEHEYSAWLHSEMARNCTGATGKGDSYV